ncbi:MAG: dUTP diphosphatase [Bdellovibrionaceae bacterium]|nr:dUTP diphosphatase [Bdellovibrionales bacterium]MCB9082876.1 dUTP diphosphatase [Pseudobdellovibrionaceae bacterium]
MKHFSTRVEALAGVVERFVEQNFIEKDQLDAQLKGLLQNAEKFVKDSWSGRFGGKLRVKVRKWDHFKGDLPSYQSELASGFDVRAQLDQPISLSPGQRALVATGLSFEIPPGFELQVRPRSGWAIREGVGLVNAPGTVDADYRGEVKVILINFGQQTVIINDQDRIAQLVLCPVLQAELEAVTDLGETERGEGGFGSTGQSDLASASSEN